MADKKAQDIVRLYDQKWAKNANFRSIWQEAADLMFPRESNIEESLVPGSKRTDNIYDTTAIVDSTEMADGLLSALIPTGEFFFQWNVSKDNPAGINEAFERWAMNATDKQHRALFASNFMQMSAETMRSLIVFGTGNQYSEYSLKQLGLNFKDYDIALYVTWKDSDGRTEGQAVKFPYTAQQAFDEWDTKAGKSVVKAMEKPESRDDVFHFIHMVRPNNQRNILMGNNKNLPFGSVYVSVKDEVIVDEGGYEEFPYHISRWMETSGEVMGRGVGTEILPQVKVLNRAMQDFIELCNKHVNPPREVLESFDGEVDVTPGALNYVMETGSIKALEQAMLGNFPIAEKEILMLRGFVDKAFLKNAFSPITDLKGDRRTTLEIRQRKLEGLKRVGQPVGRIQSAWLEPMLQRTLRLLIKHGEIPKPPAGLELLDLEYLGLMSNALSSGQSTAFQQWVAVGAELNETVPVFDNVNVDAGYRHLGKSLGVKAEHINTTEQRDAIRQERRAAIEAQQQAEMLAQAAQGYSQTTGAPEQGSPAGAIMEAVQ
jgi:hypothetical protein